MSPWVIALEVLGAIAVLALLGLVLLAFRRRYIQRGGSFDCSLRLDRKRFGRGWTLGVARFSGDRLLWFKVFSLSTRPRRVVPRDGLKIMERRAPGPTEALAILPNHLVLECKVAGHEVDLAMSEESLTGFLAWLEASPPGRPLRLP